MHSDAAMRNLSVDDQRLFADQVHQQFQHTVFGTLATLINSLILALVLRAHVPAVNLVVWLACAGLVSVCRLTLHWCYHASHTQTAAPQRWNAWFVATIFLSGVLWGSTAVFLFPLDAVGHQAFIAFVAGGMVAGAVGAFTAVLPVFYIFSLPALLPLTIRFLMLGDEIHFAMGAMVLLFLLLTGLSARRMHQETRHLLALKYERGTLIDNLQQEVKRRSQAQQDLHRQKEQVENIVTERTAQLKHVNQRLRAILNYAPLVIWAIDRDGVFTFSDGKGLEKIALASGKVVGESVFERYAEYPPIVDITRRVLAGEFISETIHYDDVYFEVRYQPVIDADDQVTGAIGVAIDVTEQITARKALRRSREKYRELVENINDVIFAVDRQGGITFISPVIESVLGYRGEDLIGKCFFDFVDGRDRQRIEKDFSRSRSMTGSPGEYRFIDKAGEQKWCRVSSRPVAEENDHGGVQGVLVDVTWSTHLKEQLQRAQKMEALGTLAGGVAHDLNNILSAIVSYPELLLMDLSEDSPLRQPLTTIKQSGENAAAIVQDLLTMARRGVHPHELLNLNRIVTSCLQAPEVRSLVKSHAGLEITTRLSPDLFNVNGSSAHIIKSLISLIANAAEAMPDGGRIEIATDNRYRDKVEPGFESVKEGEYVVLSVEDAGVGIPEQDQTRIFEPFYSSKVMGRSGSGLGMAVVWGTVKDHQGFIDIHSREGQGTRFDLYFPATRECLPKIGDSQTDMDIAGSGQRILVVDDMPAQREIAAAIFESLGYRVATVASGEEAVAYLAQNSADLVVLDMIMDPGMDGYETYRRMIEIHPGQKAIIASGYSETERVKKTQSLGAGAYIKKPYTLSAIGRLIKAELQREN